MSGPLGALPQLSPSTRRALYGCGVLALVNACALATQAWALASVLTAVVTAKSAPDAVFAQLVVLALMILARSVLGWAIETVSARAAAGAKEELRAKLVDSALRRGPGWIDHTGRAELTTLATKGLDALDAYFTKYLPALVTAAVAPLVAGVSILFVDWVSALVIVVTVPLIPLFAWLVGRFTETRTARATAAAQRLSGHMLELIRALPVLSAFGRARAQRQAVERVSESHRRATMSTLRIAFLSALVLELLSSLSVALVAVGIGFRLVGGDLDLATGLFVLVLAPECFLPLRAAGAAHHASEDGLEAVRRVHEIEWDSVVGEAADLAPPDSKSTVDVRELRVSRRDGYAPDGLSFSARPGEVVHLDGFGGIGPSGSGKSTTFAALLGFVHPESGTITYGGRDVREFDHARWRRLLAWVPQNPVFTGGTVADELAVAAADQPELSPAQAREALSDAAAEHLHQRRVDSLSTGERQRVAVARAFLRLRGHARVLLLDEPTAHLDPATADHVHSAFRRAAECGATVLLASHRPHTETGALEPAPQTQPVHDSAFPPARGRLRDLVHARGLVGVGLGALSLLAALALTATSAWLIARASQQPPVLALSVAAVGVRAFALSRATLRYAERLATHDAAFRLAGRLRRRLWDALVRLGPVRTAGLRRGDGVARLVDDADAVRDLVPRVLLPPLVAAPVVVGAVAVQTAVLPLAGLVLAVSLLVAATAGPAVAVWVERRATATEAEGRRRVSADVFALLDSAAELVAFGAHGSRRRELAADDARLAVRARQAARGAGAATAVITISIGAGVFGAAWLGGVAVSQGRLAPELAPLLALVPLAAAEAVTALPTAAQQWRSLRAAQARLAPVFEATEAGDDVAALCRAAGHPDEVPRSASPERSDGGAAARGADSGEVRRPTRCAVGSPERSDGAAGWNGVVEQQERSDGTLADHGDRADHVNGADPGDHAHGTHPHGDRARRPSRAPERSDGVTLVDVSARWPGAAEPTLRGVSVRIPKGAHVAVVGPSGGGKSTLVAVLLGLLRPESGRVWLPERVTWCPQEPRLVSTTVRENLRLASPGGTDRRFLEALWLAGLPGWTDRLDEFVGVGGTKLSGGEAQRLALARALLVDDAEVVLLDEPTAHVDAATSEALLARLRSALRGRTVVQVTHRLSEAHQADMVVRVDNGALAVVREPSSEPDDAARSPAAGEIPAAPKPADAAKPADAETLVPGQRRG